MSFNHKELINKLIESLLSLKNYSSKYINNLYWKYFSSKKNNIYINPHRSRWINSEGWYNLRFKEVWILEKNIIEISKTINKRWLIKILEVWCWLWVTLLELMKKSLNKELPSLKLYWINLEQRYDNKKSNPPLKMFSSEDFKEVAKHPALKLFTQEEINSIPESKRPTVDFYDAGQWLKFKDQSFDLIISLISVPFIKRKDVFLDEVWRILKPGWKAILHLDKEVTEEKYPRSPRFLRYQTPRILVKDKNWKIISFKTILKDMKEEWFDIELKDWKNLLMIFTKNLDFKFEFSKKLEFLEYLSFDLTELHNENIKNWKNIQWEEDWYLGWRSVYERRE